MTRMYEHHDAPHAVREGVIIAGGEGRLLLANDEAQRLLDLPADAEGRHVLELGLEADTADLLASGRVATDEVHLVGDRLLAINQRPTDLQGGPPGSVATLRDSTERPAALSGRAEVARERLKLLYDIGVGVGTSLDVTRTAETLAEVAVPRFADFATVDLADSVLNGEEPDRVTELRRTAYSGIRKDAPLYPVGEIHFIASTPQARSLRTGERIVEPDLEGAPAGSPRTWNAPVVEYGIHSLITVPLRVGPLVMGVVNFWRSRKPKPSTRRSWPSPRNWSPVPPSIDNARRSRKHAMAVTLRRRSAAAQPARAERPGHRLPLSSGAGGGGRDWFDVLPLSGARVAVVVGDVVGHGLHAAAAMGRLRTAVHNFSALDLPPDEIIGLFDELVGRIDQDEASADNSAAITGATCLYAVYDRPPALHGHPGPAIRPRRWSVPTAAWNSRMCPPGPRCGWGCCR